MSTLTKMEGCHAITTNCSRSNKSALLALARPRFRQLTDRRIHRAITEWIKSMGKKLLMGSINLISTPFPVTMFEPRSYLEKLADVWVYPRYLSAAAAASCNPVERMKLVSTWFIAGELPHTVIWGPMRAHASHALPCLAMRASPYELMQATPYHAIEPMQAHGGIGGPSSGTGGPEKSRAGASSVLCEQPAASPLLSCMHSLYAQVCTTALRSGRSRSTRSWARHGRPRCPTAAICSWSRSATTRLSQPSTLKGLVRA